MSKYVLGKDIPLPEGVNPSQVSDGYHTFGDLYNHRILNFLALMTLADQKGLECGWSRVHYDGFVWEGWVIAWITAPSGKQIRYHVEDSRPLLAHLERDRGSQWNGKEETLDALTEIINV